MSTLGFMVLDREKAPAAPLPAPGAPPLRTGRRLQRSRKKGAKTPDGAVYVGRPTLFDNPFRRERFGHVRSVRLHRRWLEGRLGALAMESLGYDGAEIDAATRLRAKVLRALPRLRGRDLQCWCPVSSRWCHADVLLELAAEA